MRWNTLVFLAFAASGSASPQGYGAVTDMIRPEGGDIEGCEPSYNGKFQFHVKPLMDTSPDNTQALKCDESATGEKKPLILTLDNSVLFDSKRRTAYIADNYQFQFDGPPQAGAQITAGFSICSNGSLALGPSAVFYQCLSGDFYNLYNQSWAAQCEPVRFVVNPCGDGSKNMASQGKVVATSMVRTTIINELDDGQPQARPTALPVPICQIGDGQVQALTTPCADVEPVQTPTPVSQIDDGQPQVPVSHSRSMKITRGSSQATPTVVQNMTSMSSLPDNQTTNSSSMTTTPVPVSGAVKEVSPGIMAFMVLAGIASL